MSDKAVINAATGEWLKGPYCADDAYVPGPAEALIEIADGWPDNREWKASTRTFVPPPIGLTVQEIFALYTPTEKLRIFGSDIPEVRTLVALLMVRTEPVMIGSTEHSQGTALLAGLGLLDGPTRAARITAGEKPE